MAASNKTGPDSKSEGLVELGKLMESALARHGVSARSIAQRAAIGASHFSKVLKAKRTLRRAKLLVLADLLGLDRDKVLRLAGLGPAEPRRLDLGRVTLLRMLDKFTLNVVVTPRFYDAALFMWMFRQQPLAEVGVETQLRRTEWNSVPAELASYTYSVGFHDRTPELFRLGRWSHLSLYKGDALIARAAGPAHGQAALESLAEQSRKKGRRLSLITIDHASVDQFCQSAGLEPSFEVEVIPNPDVALESFRAGAGDLLLGGLPQRLALRKGEFKELVYYSKEFPHLYSFRSLICSERMLTEKRPLLHAIDALWYDTCRRLYDDGDFRAAVFAEIGDILERHGVEKSHLVKEDFDALFSPAGLEWEVFARTPADLCDAEQRLRTARSS